MFNDIQAAGKRSCPSARPAEDDDAAGAEDGVGIELLDYVV
jgi:hypothetical protein